MHTKRYIIVLVASLLTYACSPNIDHREKPALVVDTITIAPPIETMLRTFNGQVVPADLTPLAFRLEGEIVDVAVREGDEVKKGQVLARLDNTRLKQAVNDAQARLDLVSRQLARGEELLSRNMISSSELEELSANYTLVVANAKLAEVRLGYTQLISPITGIVSQVAKQDFERVDAGETVLSLYQSQDVYVEISVSDSVLTRLKPLLINEKYRPKALFSDRKEAFSLTYLEHTSELNAQSQTYQFWMKMRQVKPRILPGTNVQVTVDMVKSGLTLPQGFQLPLTAIDSTSVHGQFSVWKVEQGKAVSTPVEVGIVNTDGVIVVNGVREGDVIINSNLRKLRANMVLEGATM